tara:strand:- start:33980 stop:36412 length:2433 start_codon:yes stop_codon:yes gene_type:complete
MFKNHFKIAFRSLKNQAFFTFLNIFGLTIGMAGALLISLYIYDELGYDKMFKDADRIYRIDTDIKFGGTEMLAGETSPPMAAALKNDLSQVETTVRLRDLGSMLIRKNETETNTKETDAAYADASFLDFFSLEVLEGDRHTALTQPNTLVLTKTAAEKHFPIEEAVGKTVVLNNNETYTITGVINDLPKNSLLRNHSMFLAMAGNPASKENIWGSNNFFTFIKLIPGAQVEAIKEPLQGMLDRYMLPWAQSIFPGMTKEAFIASGNYIKYHTMPLPAIHLHSSRDNELSANSTIQNVYILLFIGIFLIILASVNFMNLSTAHSLKRAKEVGIRKTLGSNKSELVKQFLTESGLISLISMLFSLLITVLVLPYFNALADKDIAIPFFNPIFWGALVVATVLLGLVSGSYPAFFMSRFRPVSILKGSGESSVGGVKVRNYLVVFQFAISVFLIVSTLVVFQQLQYIQAKDLGFAKDQVIVINDVYAAGNKTKALKDELKKLSQVKSVTMSSYLPTPSSRSNSTYFWEGARQQENAVQMQNWNVDEDYISTLNIELVAGRNFDKQYIADSTSVIINEMTLEKLGVSADEALGMRIFDDMQTDDPVFYSIIGVVKDFHYESLHENIGALGLFMIKSSGLMAAKLNSGDFKNTISKIETIWNELAPGQPFSYSFLDESFNNTYKSEQQLGDIFVIFTILSIFIACLGLFGLATFNAEKRTKEIGVRKVLGASVGQISYRLTADFLKLVGIAILISLPIGWYAMNKWLEDFSYRIDIAWWIFALAALLAVFIAVITVGYQSIKAAIVNPVKSLRSE